MRTKRAFVSAATLAQNVESKKRIAYIVPNFARKEHVLWHPFLDLRFWRNRPGLLIDD
jgi:hypothetical protein